MTRKRAPKGRTMRAQSAALGMAAAAALSGPASASPCADLAPIHDTLAGSGCVESRQRVDDDASSNQCGPEPTGLGAALLSDDTGPANIIESDTLLYPQVKITNLQATMTGNSYVAGRIPPAPASPADELMMYAPDYLSVKLLPHLQRKPVGIGLVTLPKPPVKKSDASPAAKPPLKTTP
jgi:hypothetical protein